MLYLVLHRHLQLISLGRTVVFATFDLVSFDFSEASDALAFIIGAAEERINRLYGERIFIRLWAYYISQSLF